MKPMDLSHSVVLITGGARGIGLATAQAFATAGATVYTGDLDTTLPPGAPDASPQPRGSAIAGSISGPWPLDVTSHDSFARIVDNVIADTGRIDILVNNAGVMPLGHFLEEPDELSRTTLDVNLWGLIHGLRLVLPHMIAQGNGHVVNLASMAGKIPFPGMAVYNASKYAAVGLTAAVRRELRGTGVTVSAVLPSAVRTSLSSGVRLGGLLPTVDAADVAAAILRTCHTRQAEVAVPRWLAAWKVLDGLTPSSLMTLGRRLAGDDRGLTADATARAAYTDRVATFTHSREA
ncbi:SDR family oxidoreductase [Kribbella sp. NPDC026596]|uniref:SDR family oxidoreductase n=1 Tax=Kribbella sp. NPDC026596 TaxID=3155122 RepID=UPI0033D23965